MGFFASAEEIARSAAMDAANIAGSNANRLNNLQQTVEGTDELLRVCAKYIDGIADQNNILIDKVNQLITDNKELRNKVSRLEEQVNRMAGYTR